MTSRFPRFSHFLARTLRPIAQTAASKIPQTPETAASIPPPQKSQSPLRAQSDSRAQSIRRLPSPLQPQPQMSPPFPPAMANRSAEMADLHAKIQKEEPAKCT